MAEPLCPYDKYENFRDIQKDLPEDKKLDVIIDLLFDLPDLNRSTIIYLARFFRDVTTHPENLMNTYNIAVIITPNIFRVQTMTVKDMMNHGTLTDVFSLIMKNVEHVIERLRSRDTDPNSLIN